MALESQTKLETLCLLDLEWERITTAIAFRCCGPRSQLRELPLASNREDAKRALDESAEALERLRQADAIPLEGLVEIRESLALVRRGGVLDGTALNDIRSVLKAARVLRRYLAERAEVLPYLYEACTTDPGLDEIEDEIATSITIDGSIVDHANPELRKLRREVHEQRESIIRKLEELIAQHASLLQDNYYTLREGRYVLPIRTDAHERFEGIVHGTSASGATIFIEPRVLVERGNRFKMIQAELEREEARHLSALCELVRRSLYEIEAAACALDHADLRAACARFGLDIRGEIVELGEGVGASLKGLRHPLLVLDQAEVVANDIELQAGRALVISGPNAGGKTIALKALGLSALMMRAGLPLAAEKGSVCGFFPSVSSAIAEEQHLSKNLSSFAAHATRICEIMAHASRESLVLLDELAGATDPEAGAALACAIVEALCANEITTVVTTHYEALKALAISHPNMDNISGGFDLERMEPTFEMMPGVPGASNALEVAARYGLPRKIIDAARRMAPRHTRVFEETILRLQTEAHALKIEREALARDQLAVDHARRELKEEIDRLKRRDKNQLSKEADALQREIKQARNELAQLGEILKRKREEKTAQAMLAGLSAAHEVAVRAADAISDEVQPLMAEDALESGQYVWLKSWHAKAQVLELGKDGRVHVEAGAMKLWVERSDLGEVPLAKRALAKSVQGKSTTTFVPKVRTRSNTLDVRGLSVDDALGLATTFLDRMYGAAQDTAYILHGVGSGALREAIHAELSNDATYVSEFRLGRYEEGGSRVTVISLK